MKNPNSTREDSRTREKERENGEYKKDDGENNDDKREKYIRWKKKAYEKIMKIKEYKGKQIGWAWDNNSVQTRSKYENRKVARLVWAKKTTNADQAGKALDGFMFHVTRKEMPRAGHLSDIFFYFLRYHFRLQIFCWFI